MTGGGSVTSGSRRSSAAGARGTAVVTSGGGATAGRATARWRGRLGPSAGAWRDELEPEPAGEGDACGEVGARHVGAVDLDGGDARSVTGRVCSTHVRDPAPDSIGSDGWSVSTATSPNTITRTSSPAHVTQANGPTSKPAATTVVATACSSPPSSLAGEGVEQHGVALRDEQQRRATPGQQPGAGARRQRGRAGHLSGSHLQHHRRGVVPAAGLVGPLRRAARRPRRHCRAVTPARRRRRRAGGGRRRCTAAGGRPERAGTARTSMRSTSCSRPRKEVRPWSATPRSRYSATSSPAARSSARTLWSSVSRSKRAGSREQR